ncbi:MAG: aa3-type cytochrome c oxidase subunit IV [Pseudomonadota bacterium]
MASEHKHGEMNIDVQERAFAGFMSFTVRAVVVIIAVLILLAIFAT